MKPDEFKSLVETLSTVIDARANTTETVFKAEMKASEERVTKRLEKRIEEAKEESRTELASKEQVAQVAIAIHEVDVKLTRKVHGHERRIDELEKEKGLPNPDKH